MPSRFPLKRSTSSDTIDTVDSFDTIDMDVTFVDRVCTKMKKATSPFSTLFVAGANRQTSSDVVVKEKRVGISLSSLIRRGADRGEKIAWCDQSVYTQETADIWKIVDATIETEEKKDIVFDEEASDSDDDASDTDENEYVTSSSSEDDHSTQVSAMVFHRQMHHRSVFDKEFKKREEERRSARETAAVLVRQRNSQRHVSHDEFSRNSEVCRKSRRRNSVTQNHET